MACVSGSNIVDDGLIFHIDMANTSKSAVGVNLVSQDGQDLTTIGSYGLLARSKVSDPESPTGYALSMRVTDNAVNSASRISIGTGTHISLTNGHVAVTVKKEGPGLNIVPKVYTGGGWYTLSPLDGGSPYITNEYRRFATNVVFNTNSGGPAPAFSMTNGWGLANRDTTTTTFWHSFQATNLIGNTVYVDGVIPLSESIVDIAENNTVTPTNITLGQVGSVEFDGIDDFIDADLTGQYKIYCLDFWLYNNYTINNNDGSQGSSGGEPYQTLLNFNRVGTSIAVAFGGWTGTATNEAIHIWGNYPGAGNDSTMTYTRDAVPVGWHNITFNWNGSDYDIWVDGIKSTTYPRDLHGHATLIEAYNMRIGRNYGGNYYFDGKLSSMKLYNKQLTDRDVKQNFEASRSRYGI